MPALTGSYGPAAREVAAAAPPGVNTVMLPYLAHFEHAMREFGWDRRDVRSLMACRRYSRRPEVRQELDGWAVKWRAGQHTVGRAMTCRHWLALYYTLADRNGDAKAVFEEIGAYAGTTVAWGYFFPTAVGGFVAAWQSAHGVR